MEEQPFIFFAFANSPERYLPNLETEFRGILDYFIPLRYERGLIDFDHRQQTRTEDFFTIFNKIGPKITILHYSGHAEHFSMELDDDKLTIEKFANTISGWNNLQLVFLNGCSTAGMVDMLLEKGVKAVIATTEEIDDNKACDFSTLFYEHFCVEKKPLKIAFKQTINRLNNYVYDEKTAFVARGGGDRSEFEEILEELPWALYYRVEEESILDWQLIMTANSRDIDTTLLKKIETIKKAIKEGNEEIPFLEEDLSDLKKKLERVGDDKKSHVQKRIARKEKELAEVETDLTAQYSKLKEIIKSSEKKTLKENLKLALRKLNYRPQLQLFEDKIITNKINAFIVQGGHQCGQDLLLERLIEKAGLRFEGEFHEEIKVDFSANSLTLENILTRIKTDLWAIEAFEPNEIIKEIYEKYYAEGKDLVFIFNNIHHFETDKTFPVIKTFWENFLTGFLPYLKGQPPKNRIILIVIDKGCQFKKTANGFVSDKEKIFQDNLKNIDNNFSQWTHVMPIVHPVFAQQLSDWKTDQDLPIDFGLTTEKLEKITGNNGNLMLPTIKELCKITNMENLYELYFSQYGHRKTNKL